MFPERVPKSVLIVLTATAATAAAAATPDPVLWPEHQRAFFQDGPALLLDEKARQELLAADTAERERLIAEFLADPIPETTENELVAGIERRRRLVGNEVATPHDDRSRLLFLHGAPVAVEKIDCGTTLVPVEIWNYGPQEQELLLYQPPGRRAYRLWRPLDGKRVLYSSLMEGWFQELQDFGQEQRRIDIQLCKAVGRVDQVTLTRGLVDEQPDVGLSKRLRARLREPEDLAAWSVAAAATPLPEPGPVLDLAKLEVEFPFRAGQRVATRFVVTLAPGGDLAVELDEQEEPEISLEVEGLLEYQARVFEEFKVRFYRPPPAEGESVALVWDRRLRPGRHFVARIRVRDTLSGASAELVRVISVPREVARVVGGGSGRAVPVEEVAAGHLEGVDALVLVPPVTDGLSRAWRAEALVTGERIRKVVFSVDDQQQLIKTRPPFTADLRLAAVPVEQVVTAAGFDRAGELVAEDRVVLNKARGMFRVRIVNPREGVPVAGDVMARAEVSVPDEGRLEAVEFSINEIPLATLTAPPWEVPLPIDASGQVTYLTVTARLADGRRVEDVVFLNAPQNLARVDVSLVELFATVTDGSGRLIENLEEDDFQVLEAGQERPIQSFDLVHNLPLVVGFAMDASTSMADHMAEARQAAIGFLHSVLRRQDRAFAVAFSDKPLLVAPPTDDIAVVERALSEVHSSGWTTLYDAVVKSLFYFRGFGGRRALVVLSDGEDTASRASFAETLEYAKQSGAVIYSVALGGGAGGGLGGKLKRLATETGGRFFRVSKAAGLDAVYTQIERELRSQYFLTFVPTSVGETDLSTVEVRVRNRRLKVRVTRGYAP